MSKIKNGELGQYGAEHFEQQQFGTSGVEKVNVCTMPLVDLAVVSHLGHFKKLID